MSNLTSKGKMGLDEGLTAKAVEQDIAEQHRALKFARRVQTEIAFSRSSSLLPTIESEVTVRHVHTMTIQLEEEPTLIGMFIALRHQYPGSVHISRTELLETNLPTCYLLPRQYPRSVRVLEIELLESNLPSCYILPSTKSKLTAFNDSKFSL